MQTTPFATPFAMNAARSSRIVLAALLAFGVAAAQVPVRPDLAPPPPLPDTPGAPATAPAPPPQTPGPGANDFSTSTEPELQVTRFQREENLVEEYRSGNRLQYIRVTPRNGRPYYLIPNASGTTYLRRDSIDPQLSVPMWLLFSW